MKRRVLLSVLAATVLLAVSTQFAQAQFGNRLFAKFNPCAPVVTACEPCAPAACEPCAPACEPACYDACCAPPCRPFAAFRAKFRCHMESFRARFCNPCAPCGVAPCAPCEVTACEPVACAPCEPVAPACEPVCMDTCDPCCAAPCAPFRPFAKLRARLAAFNCCNPCDPCTTACEPACY
ncbi:MAG: hypothetical protein FWH27_07340 [Planctomycetaceae bacterium]|nr:hypothetical protein [Planctomycetaceae bacterium]